MATINVPRDPDDDLDMVLRDISRVFHGESEADGTDGEEFERLNRVERSELIMRDNIKLLESRIQKQGERIAYLEGGYSVNTKP